MSHVTHMNESCRIYNIIVHMCQVTYMNQSQKICHNTHLNESCHTYESVTEIIPMQSWHICKRLVSVCNDQYMHVHIKSHANIHVGDNKHKDESCLICERVKSHIWTSRITYTLVRTNQTGKLSKHIYALDLGPKLPSQVISDLGLDSGA